MKVAAVLATIVLATSTFSQTARSQGNKEANNLARQGSEAAKNKQWDQAVDALRKATEMERKYGGPLAAALQQRAAANASAGKFPEAAADYDEAIKLNPRNASALEGRAYVAMKMNDMDRALAAYSEAIKINPDEPRYYQYRGYILEVKGDVKGAMADTDKLLKLQKDNPDAVARKKRLEAKQAQAQGQGQPPGPGSTSPAPPAPPSK